MHSLVERFADCKQAQLQMNVTLRKQIIVVLTVLFCPFRTLPTSCVFFQGGAKRSALGLHVIAVQAGKREATYIGEPKHEEEVLRIVAKSNRSKFEVMRLDTFA